MADKVLLTRDVFGVQRDVPVNYVDRAEVDWAFFNALAADRHIVVHGGSKQGKTCLRKHTLLDRDYLQVTCSTDFDLSSLFTTILKEAGSRILSGETETAGNQATAKAKATTRASLFGLGGEASVSGEGTTVREKSSQYEALNLDPQNVNDIIRALDAAGAPQFIVLEDFHYLQEVVQKEFAFALKAFHESSVYTFIIVGVWLDQNRLQQYNGDLTGRVHSIDADKWDRESLKDVIAKGAEKLKVVFEEQFANALVHASRGSVWVVQEACKIACEDVGVAKTCSEPKTVTGNAESIVARVVSQNDARYHGFLSRFSDGFQKTRLEMHRWVLLAVLSADMLSLESGLSYAYVSSWIKAEHPEKLNTGNITNALQSTSLLQVQELKIKPIVLDYDTTTRKLCVVDKAFTIWLHHQDREELLAGLRV